MGKLHKDVTCNDVLACKPQLSRITIIRTINFRDVMLTKVCDIKIMTLERNQPNSPSIACRIGGLYFRDCFCYNLLFAYQLSFLRPELVVDLGASAQQADFFRLFVRMHNLMAFPAQL
ncbi:hypothetical protein DCAR_0100663 [Daucus carota subsp. sativus]|uniref:Uncharacterized protein n=1 Tax=Daucus carota subsp. sativus TaxID=79200 RepID=A0AAF0W4E8_DAUCS|nr:PREDICTED: uncharacterized protein LOC108215682 [Daucus carota subsp. sativus]WOG81513.1 hypothetical protein DCAR_0100663 [Daucus carota subsp. sativus]